MILPYSNLQISHQNPGATNKLILPIQVICNTSDEDIFNNIRANSIRGNWLKSSPAHDGVAVLCGSAPSLLYALPDLHAHRQLGGKIFAMNGAAEFLAKNGIIPDYQVLIDAREETSTLIGRAHTHLFASQVHPVCFELKPDAQLWHLQVENMEDVFPDYDDEYVVIGGAASVGNTATCLAYAMGYRNLQIYGYDSSYTDGKSHASHQKINDGEPCCYVTFNGQEYLVSLTMKLQAEKFQDTAADLKALGCHIEVHGTGLLPEMYRHPDKVKEHTTEAAKYSKMWEHEAYRETAPGELCADKFVEVAKPVKGYRIIDFGCGTGRGSLKLRELTECEVVQVDFTENSRDENAKDFLFYQCDLSEKLPVLGDYGFCTDVMEHIEPEKVDAVLDNLFDSTPDVFFQISTVHDNMGALIGQPLHLTVRPHEWWKSKLEKYGAVMWEEKHDIASLFFVKKEAA